MIASEPTIHAALLDTKLGGILVFDVADALTARGLPFVFATSYDRWSIPERFSEVLRLEKPLRPCQVGIMLEMLLEGRLSIGTSAVRSMAIMA